MSDRLWRWMATAWILLVPILWWKGWTLEAIQGISWHVGTIGLVAVSCLHPPRRFWTLSWPEGALFAGAIGTGLVHMVGYGYSLLILNSLIAWLGVWALVQWAPTADWITTRLVWVAWINLIYWGIQWTGYDPILLRTAQAAGLFGRVNQLAVLWVMTLPWCPWMAVCCLWLGNLTSRGVMGIWLSTPVRPSPWMVVCLSLMILLTSFRGLWHASLWAMKVAPRLLVWKAMVGQIVWSPLWGYGFQAWNAMTPYPHDPWGYNTLLDALHVGGVLLAGPLCWVVWKVWRSPSSRERTALLLMGGMAMTQDVWNSARLILVTIALYAAWTIRRLDAG